MKHIILFVFACCSALGADWNLPAANQGNWTPGVNLGVPGGIAQYLAGGANDRAVTGNVINVVTTHGADNTGVANCRDALAAAVAAASPGDVIYFPAGRYKFTSGAIYTDYKDNITIRGAGVGVTYWDTATVTPILVCNSPGDFGTGLLTVTGTKTKGTTVLTVSSTAGYTVGELVKVAYENETDATRIQAGAAPVWSPYGYPFVRAYIAEVVSLTATTIEVSYPLPADGTNLDVRISRMPFTNRTDGWGIEDISFTFDNAAHTTQVFTVSEGKNWWFHNLDFENWSRTSDSGSCIKIYNTVGSEIRRIKAHALPGPTTSDGAIETGSNSGLWIEDNIFTGKFDVFVYDSGNSNYCAITYNFGDNISLLTNFHAFHPSLNLIEGNAAFGHRSDAYGGSSSHNTLFRNYFTGPFHVILNRFKRNYVLAGNIFGTDGSQSASLSFGNPNMGNGFAEGFAGPTGLSDQAGQLDYGQIGYYPGTYTIQGSDIFAGDFWQDWEVTGTLTTRTSDTVGVFTVSGGLWFTGSSVPASSVLRPTVHWSNKGSNINQGYVDAVSGNQVTIRWGSGVLPAEGTPVQMYPGVAGWQERDLDVLASTMLVENYHASAGGTGSVQNGTADTLPASQIHPAKPSWFGSLPWPPFDPNTPVFDVTRIPAGDRYVNGGGAPTAPDAPSSLAATAISSSQINLTWTDNSDNEISFRLERRVGAGAWGTVTSAAANATSYSNTGLSASTTYEYRVFAVNAAGDSAASNTDSATTSSGGGGAANATVNHLTIETLVIP